METNQLSFLNMSVVSEKVVNSIIKNCRLKSIIVEYSQKNKFNADLTSLFFKCMHNKTLHPKGNKCIKVEKPK